MQHVVVVGAGISGLAAAWELTGGVDGPRDDLRVTVLEAGDRVGGKLRGEQVAGVPVDVGAESVLARRPEAVDLIREVGLGEALVHPTDARASIWSRGRRHPLPPRTVMGVPADPAELGGLLTAAEVDRILAEAPVPVRAGDVSVGDLVEARLGGAVVDRLVDPLLGGVYAGHAHRISAAASVPGLLRAAQQGRGLVAAAAESLPPAGAAAPPRAPVFAGLDGGVHRLPARLRAALEDRGVSVLTGQIVRELHQVPHSSGGARWRLVTGPRPRPTAYEADAVIVAVPAAPAARLLREVAPTASDALATVEAASMAVVTLAFRADEVGELPGSGVLVPAVEPLAIKAATFSATKWDWVLERGAAAGSDGGVVVLRASLGRHREEHVLQVRDADLVETALGDLAVVLQRRLPPPVEAHVQRWGGGLPQYAVGHVDLVAQVQQDVSSVPGLAVCGASYDGVGIPACIASGRRAAGSVLPA